MKNRKRQIKSQRKLIFKTKYKILISIFFIILIVGILTLIFLKVFKINTTITPLHAQVKDAIALRVMKNPQHLSPELWYKENVPHPGSPQTLAIDGYQAIRDGRTVYVSAANLASDKVYSNIYLISYNEGAKAETVKIYEQLLANWSFNSNLLPTGIGNVCSGDLTTACASDKDCPPNETCLNMEAKAKLTRDTKRLADLQDLRQNLTDYNYQQGSYPTLSSGTYQPNISFSVWPSWQKTLGKDLASSLPQDPINQFYGCSDPYDPTTCWDNQALKFSCPQNYYIYAYQSPTKTGDQAKVYTKLEYTDKLWDSTLDILINPEELLAACNLNFGQNANDYDNDGVPDKSDNCPTIANPADAPNPALTVSKNGDEYDNFIPFYQGCTHHPAAGIGSCGNFVWQATFNFAQAANYQIAVESANYEGSGDPFVLHQIYHRFVIRIDGQEKGIIDNPATDPAHQIGILYLGQISAGVHQVEVEWINDWCTCNGQCGGPNPTGCDTNVDLYKITLSPLQADADSDHLGDACDACPNDPLNDQDNDGYCVGLANPIFGNKKDQDNCPTVYNPSQKENPDIPGVGLACSVCQDADYDSFCSFATGGDDCNDNNQAIHPGAPEIPNGLDDNCDGKVDECPKIGEVKSCYSGPAGTEGIGICKGGSSVCKSLIWGPCRGEVTPKTEICENGVDEDCNGVDLPDCPSITGSSGGPAGYIWNADFGWVNLSTTQGNLKISGTDFSGYAWGANTGWVNFEGAHLDFATGKITGTAKGSCADIATCPIEFGKTGPIYMSGVNYGVMIDKTTGNFSGYAWARDIGWLNFGPFTDSPHIDPIIFPFCNPSPEICDGQDNDCDTQIDEDFASQGSTAASAVKSCKEICVYRPSGLYWIDPDYPTGGNPPFQAWCDMVTDGGGWTIIDYNRNNVWKNYFQSGNWHIISIGSPIATYGINSTTTHRSNPGPANEESCLKWRDWFLADPPATQFRLSENCQIVTSQGGLNKIYRATGNYYGCLWYNTNCDFNGSCHTCTNPYGTPNSYGTCPWLDGSDPDINYCYSCYTDWWNVAPSIGINGAHCVAYK